MRYQKKLNKKELQHIRKHCGGSLKGFWENREKQKQDEKDIGVMTCKLCYQIERKLTNKEAT